MGFVHAPELSLCFHSGFSKTFQALTSCKASWAVSSYACEYDHDSNPDAVVKVCRPEHRTIKSINNHQRSCLQTLKYLHRKASSYQSTIVKAMERFALRSHQERSILAEKAKPSQSPCSVIARARRRSHRAIYQCISASKKSLNLPC